jgi:hypothetical protein
LQKLFHFCLKAHGFLCHGRTSSLFVAVDSGQAWPVVPQGVGLVQQARTRGAGNRSRGGSGG